LVVDFASTLGRRLVVSRFASWRWQRRRFVGLRGAFDNHPLDALMDILLNSGEARGASAQFDREVGKPLRSAVGVSD